MSRKVDSEGMQNEEKKKIRPSGSIVEYFRNTKWLRLAGTI